LVLLYYGYSVVNNIKNIDNEGENKIMFATNKQGWDTFDMVNVLSNLPNNVKDIFIEIIRSAMTGKELTQENKDMLAYACYHSTLPIEDEEVLSWSISNAEISKIN